MAAQTNFVKFSLMQQRLFSFGLRKLILVGETRRRFTNNANRLSIHFDLNFYI